MENGLVPGTITDELNKMHPNNLMGEIIRLFMITASGAEGITLRNCETCSYNRILLASS